VQVARVDVYGYDLTYVHGTYVMSGGREIVSLPSTVVCITADDSIMAEPNRIDPTKVRAVGRMGFPWFVTVDEDSLFELDRTRYPDTALAGGG